MNSELFKAVSNFGAAQSIFKTGAPLIMQIEAQGLSLEGRSAARMLLATLGRTVPLLCDFVLELDTLKRVVRHLLKVRWKLPTSGHSTMGQVSKSDHLEMLTRWNVEEKN